MYDSARPPKRSHLHTHSAESFEVNDSWFNWLTNHNFCCQSNKVKVKSLGNEREGARDPKIALYNLELVVLGNKL